MSGIEAIKAALGSSDMMLITLIEHIKDAPTTFPTANGGNHPLWILGHVVHSEAGMVDGFILGQANPLAKWDKLFGMGTEPVADAKAYPSLDELLTEAKNVRVRTLEVLASFKEADLDKPSKAPEHLKNIFGTIGQCCAMLATHQAFHAGQVADARRALGRKPVFGS